MEMHDGLGRTGLAWCMGVEIPAARDAARVADDRQEARGY
jgi:hypothetical protein